ncbi:MAG: transcription antitermination factor NusB [Alphaproteobacteria bacterium]
MSNQSDIANLYQSIRRIDEGGSIDAAVEKFDPIKRGFLFLAIQEYYRNFENFNLILTKYISERTPKNILIILKINLVLIFFSKKPHHAIVHDAVEFSKQFDKSKLINAVLRNILRDQENLIIEKNLPDNFQKTLDKIFSSNKIREYLYQTFFAKPVDFQISLSDHKEAIYGKRVLPLKSKLLKNCFVQDIGNYEVIHATHQFFQSKKILDVCSAPGGKSILLHSLGYEVDCIDKSNSQIIKFKENLKRLDLNLNIQKKDFLKFTSNQSVQSILLDAPCSALGTFRRNPDVASKINQSKLKRNQKIQIQMLDKAINILDENGIIVYIVCSFHPFETINVIDKITQKHKNIRTLNLQSDKMIKRQNGYFINPLQFKDLGGSDIFFVSVLEKTK